MDQISQEHRLISISSPLSKDELLLTSFQGGDYISRLFEYQLEVLSANVTLDPQELIGKQVTVTLQEDTERYFTGYVTRFIFGEVKANNLRQYKLSIVPWLWFLTKTQNQRIFQEMNTKDIVSKVFKDNGFNDFEFSAKGGTKREYCVQYAESDFEFVTRLLEEEGIAYYFKHDKEKHKLLLVDKQNAYEYCDEKEVTYSKGNQAEAQITQWEHHYEFRKGEWTINDYNFEEPKKKLIVSSKTKNKFSKVKNFEHYEYPSMYDTSDGENLVSIRMEAEEAAINTIEATSDCSSFYAGGEFKLTQHAAKSEKGNYIITGIYHRAFDNSYFSGSEGQSEYGNNFVCIPADIHFRPLKTQNKPVMKGPQSAIVTGPSGEEIFIDTHGRIKVQFIWDREGEQNESSSCYLRVVQSWSGDQWGSSFIPRIGQEVIVNFLNGDPDRPLVTGTVYNGDNKPPYTSKTQSGIKTQSTKGAGKQNYNELRFEDLKGSEEIFIQAEKDFKRLVKNDEDSLIKNNHTRTVEKGDETITVSKGSRKLTVKDKISTEASDIVITGKKSIELKVGGSSIKMTSSGIVIKATKIDVKGSAMVAIKGGITKIN
ncbi:MAG: type VI secretion system tip protein TssI/VgrG [Gammaproteobacteria bacterium]|nr:type VI secretion system tip protein TssI/VgrG [Gammaproteobacteria bacterium]